MTNLVDQRRLRALVDLWMRGNTPDDMIVVTTKIGGTRAVDTYSLYVVVESGEPGALDRFEQKLSELAYEVLLHRNMVLEPHVVTAEEWETGNKPD